MTVAHLKRVLDAMPAITYRMLPDDSVYAEYTGSAISKTKFGGDEAFANSLRGPYGSNGLDGRWVADSGLRAAGHHDDQRPTD